MKFSMRTVALLTSLIALTTARPCFSGLYMIVARGSLEPPGEGTIGAVASLVWNQIPNSYSVGLNYPAGLHPYRGSEADGTAAMTAMVEEYAKDCPNGKMALIGYSQGAQVIGDTLCGTSAKGWNKTSPLAEKYAKNIVAVIQMGDPTFVPHLPYDVGTSVRRGEFKREDVRACLPYAKRIKSYCNTGDPFCASGKTLAVHFGYTAEFAAQAAAFVVKNFKNTPQLNPFPSKSPTGTSGTSGTSGTTGGPKPTSTHLTPSSTGSGGSSGAAPCNSERVNWRWIMTLLPILIVL